MNEPFDLPVTHDGKELLFPAQLLLFGFDHKFRVDVYETEVVFEPDEEQAYRAVVDPKQADKNKKINAELLQAIAYGINAVIK